MLNTSAPTKIPSQSQSIYQQYGSSVVDPGTPNERYNNMQRLVAELLKRNQELRFEVARLRTEKKGQIVDHALQEIRGDGAPADLLHCEPGTSGPALNCSDLVRNADSSPK
jgi:hypothetical protein